eukprot:COSAG01_NODE_55223_length_326_cov_2.506608_1_plen_100_part_01
MENGNETLASQKTDSCGCACFRHVYPDFLLSLSPSLQGKAHRHADPRILKATAYHSSKNLALPKNVLLCRMARTVQPNWARVVQILTLRRTRIEKGTRTE